MNWPEAEHEVEEMLAEVRQHLARERVFKEAFGRRMSDHEIVLTVLQGLAQFLQERKAS